MPPNKSQQEILGLIRQHSGKPTQHTFLDSYLGNDHPRYPISIPTLRRLAKDWMRAHREMSSAEFARLLTSLVNAKSSTEKCMVGILLDNSTADQRTFDPRLFDRWLDRLEGWAEVDSICTGVYTVTEITHQWKTWRSLLIQFSKSKNINKRRASIVLLCSPLQQVKDERLVTIAFRNVERLQNEKEILITKAISWVLRSMVKYYRKELTAFLKENKNSLPKIAVRETLVKLKTGRKTIRK